MNKLWLMLALLLAGCSILPKGEQLVVYQLPAPSLSASSAVAPAQGAVLRIDRPRASPLMESNRIVVMPRTDQLSAYQGVRWSNQAPLIVRDRLVDFGRASGRFRAVISDDVPAPATLEMASELKAFQIEYRNGQPVAVVRLQSTLLQGGSRAVLGSRTFAAEQAATGTSVEAAVAALGRASDVLASEVIVWLQRVEGGQAMQEAQGLPGQ